MLRKHSLSWAQCCRCFSVSRELKLCISSKSSKRKSPPQPPPSAKQTSQRLPDIMVTWLQTFVFTRLEAASVSISVSLMGWIQGPQCIMEFIPLSSWRCSVLFNLINTQDFFVEWKNQRAALIKMMSRTVLHLDERL